MFAAHAVVAVADVSRRRVAIRAMPNFAASFHVSPMKTSVDCRSLFCGMRIRFGIGMLLILGDGVGAVSARIGRSSGALSAFVVCDCARRRRRRDHHHLLLHLLPCAIATIDDDHGR